MAATERVSTTFGFAVNVTLAEKIDLERQGLLVKPRAARGKKAAAPAEVDSTAEATAEAEQEGGAA